MPLGLLGLSTLGLEDLGENAPKRGLMIVPSYGNRLIQYINNHYCQARLSRKAFLSSQCLLQGSGNILREPPPSKLFRVSAGLVLPSLGRRVAVSFCLKTYLGLRRCQSPWLCPWENNKMTGDALPADGLAGPSRTNHGGAPLPQPLVHQFARPVREAQGFPAT